jgi:hypothetical protein
MNKSFEKKRARSRDTEGVRERETEVEGNRDTREGD